MPKWEYKFVFKDNRMAESLFDMICGLNDLAGYGSCYKRDAGVRNLDHYFDSPDLLLESRGMVCRVRQTGEDQAYNLVIKQQALGPNGEVVYTQTEPVTLGADGFAQIKNGVFPPNVGPLLTMFAGSERLEHILTLEVHRKIVEIFGADSAIAVLNLDHIQARHPGSKEVVAEDYEIELKSDQEAFPQADVLRDFLMNAFGMIPITRSKLRRMARLIRHHTDRGRKKVILDMDTGVDDALAILLAMQSPELEVLGITIVGGNVDAAQSARNTAAVLSSLREKCPELPPIAMGESLPEGAVDASDVHGPDGLGGVCDKYLDTSVEKGVTKDAKALFKQIVHEHAPDSISLITTGPLINVARWVEECPEEIKRLKEIISMGGVFFQAGNRSQTAEFNIHSDPTSARKVVEFCRMPLSSGAREWHETLPLTFVGLDVTHQVRFRREKLEAALKKIPGDRRLEFIRDITRFYMDFYYRNEGLDGCYLHDPLAVAYVIDPTLCQAEQYHVEVEDRGEFTSGMSVADYRPTRLFKDKMKEITWVCYKVDAERFEALFHKRVLGAE